VAVERELAVRLIAAEHETGAGWCGLEEVHSCVELDESELQQLEQQ